MSKTEDPQLAVSGRAAAGTAGRVESRANAAAGPPTAGIGMLMTAGASGTIAGAAGSAAQPTAGSAGAPRVGSAGQAGTATAGGPSAQAGSGGVGMAGSAGAAGSVSTDPCVPLPFQMVDDGVPVNGAGCKQMWEGIVMTVGGRGLCTAAFISERHLISASHCYASDGAVSVKVTAPTWDNGDDHTFQAQVKRSGSDMSLDISIIDLGKPVDWATPERRFVLHAGKVPASVDMHLYGYGDSGPSGVAGTLNGVPKRATIHVTDAGKGNLSGKAGDARLCSGDSGGPAFVEKTAAVLYGINQAIVPAGFGRGSGSCAAADWTIMFTNVSEYVPFVEKAVGKACERKRVDDLDVAQCW